MLPFLTSPSVVTLFPFAGAVVVDMPKGTLTLTGYAPTVTVFGRCYSVYQNDRWEIFENNQLVWSFKDDA